MATSTMNLGELWQDDRLQAAIEAAGELLVPVDSGESRHDWRLGPAATSVPVLGESVGLEAELALGVDLIGAGSLPDPFGQERDVSPPAGGALGRLRVDAKIGASAKAAGSSGSFTLSLDAAAGAELSYRLLRPVDPDALRLSAVATLVQATRLPAAFDLGALAAGEVHQLDAAFTFRAGATLSGGWTGELQRTVDLFDGLSATVGARARASLEAAVGLALFERFSLAVGRLHLLPDTDPSWVRLRIARQSERRLTLGATVASMVDYDLSGVADVVLERIFDQGPLPRLVSALSEVAEWDLTGPNLEELVAEKLSGIVDRRLRATLDVLFAKVGVTGELAELARKVVGAYDELDERVQSWLDSMLGAVDLGADSKLRGWLDRLSRLGDGKPRVDDLFAGEGAGELIGLIELLGNRSLEELVLAGEDEADGVLAEVAGLARQAGEFLDRLPGGLDRVIASTRVGSLLSLLRGIRTKEDVEKKLEAGVARAVELLIQRLVGAVDWEAVAEDLTPVQEFASRLLSRIERFEETVRGATRHLEGQLGFSLGLELERVTSRMALTDLEFDPDDGAIRSLVRQALRTGNVGALVAGLPSLEPDDEAEDEKPREPSYALREALLSERVLKSGSVAVFLSFLGRETTTNRRLQELRVRVGRGDDGRLVRRGVYGGGFSRAHGGSGGSVLCGVRFELSGDDRPSRPLERYDSLEPSVLVTFSRDDVKTSSDEWVATESLLAQLGFDFRDGFAPQAPRDGRAESRVAAALRIPLDAHAVRGLAEDDPDEWTLDWYRAGYRWFADALFERRLSPQSDAGQGASLAAILRLPAFQQLWTLDGRTLTTRLGKTDYRDASTAGGDRIAQPLLWKPSHQNLKFRWFPPFGPLYDLARHRGRGLAGMVAIGKALAEAVKTPEHPLGTAMPRVASQALRNAYPASFGFAKGSAWANPTFLLWLVLVRLHRVAPQTLSSARGMLSVRWRPAGAEAWEEELLYRLPRGIPATAVRHLSKLVP